MLTVDFQEIKTLQHQGKWDEATKIMIDSAQKLETGGDDLIVCYCSNEESKQSYLKIINSLSQQGAKALILGCTEITLLISQDHCSIPVYDTTRLHAECAVKA